MNTINIVSCDSQKVCQPRSAKWRGTLNQSNLSGQCPRVVKESTAWDRPRRGASHSDMRIRAFCGLLSIPVFSAVLVSCSADDGSAASGQHAELISTASDSLEPQGLEPIGGTSSSGQSEGTVELTVDQESVALYAACLGEIGDGEITANGFQVSMDCDEESGEFVFVGLNSSPRSRVSHTLLDCAPPRAVHDVAQPAASRPAVHDSGLGRAHST